MIGHVEVTPGSGTVIRYGSIVAWVGAGASPALISFLAQSVRNLGASPSGGQHMADHIAGVLYDRDPEPAVPFAVIGPGDDGWAALLHGPVQVWDGVRWLVADSRLGWIRCSVSPDPSVSVNAAGARVPPLSPDDMWDLEAGVVPGSGFVMLPAARFAPRLAAAAPVEPVPVEAGPDRTAVLDTPSPTSVLPVVGAVAAAHELEGSPEVAALAGSEPVPEPVAETPQPAAAQPEPEVAPAEPEPAGPVGPQGSLNLRAAGRPGAAAAALPLPPLPVGLGADRSVPGAPVVAGILCPRGHLNRPGLPSCVRCSTPIPPEAAYSVSGTRPALGCLIVDDSSIYRLDRGYLIGSRPERDPTVRGNLALPLGLKGDDVSAAHAEIRLHDWDVVVVDRASASGTYLFEPGASQWVRLIPYDPKVLKPGTHVAFGQRIITFVTPWIARDGGARPNPQEISETKRGQ